ncbi:efflux RND transporter periplasmic adaptor subunit [Litorisediminicola beolgyonensis]|uniref:Efflux RND transporter periplasmic adaptor subunit n=1 Tax=Litorisediminicola beolgyonensis TaxID=1173614 RepID=A0ABW3ZN12_9RHOB
MMRHASQLLLSLAAVAVALFVWITYVPSAAAFLDRIGVAEMLGIEVAAAESSGGRGGFGGRGPARVVTAEVVEAETNDVVEAIGDGRALRTALLRAEVSGEVTEVATELGGTVAEGDVLLRLDAAAQRIALERAQLMLEDASDEAQRLTRLQGTGAVTEVREREAQLALRTAELALREAQYELDRRSVRAPFAGRVGLIDVEIGDLLSAQEEVATLVDRSEILVEFRVPARVVGRVSPGMTLEARPLGLPDEVLSGTIRAVDSLVDRTSRTLRVQGRLPNDNDALRSGMAFVVTLRFPGETLVAVDPLAVQWASEGSYVWAVRDGKAERVFVTIRQRDADRVLVEGELAPGETVVIEGVQTLRPGAEVELAPEKSAALPSPAPRHL